MISRIARRLPVLFVLSLLILAPVHTSAQSLLSVEWVFGPEGKSVASVPDISWLGDGTALLYDTRRPEGERTIERFDPVTLKREAAVDRVRALASLKSVAPDALSSEALPWPDAIDGRGHRALYRFKDDLFVLELSSATFSRLTTTPASEKAASFSPDGSRVAFVRDNDLYVIDVASLREQRLTEDGSATLLNGTLSWVYWEEIFGRRDIGYWWSPDSAALAYLQSDESPVDVSYFVDFAPAVPRVVEQRYPRAGRPNPRVRVGVVEIAQPVTRWIRIDDKPFEYIARVKWLPDGKRVSVETLTREQTELGLYLADRLTGAATRVLTETDPGWVNMNDDLYFLKDGVHFLWASERSGYMHLYRYRLDGTLENQVTRGPWAIASAGGVAFWVRQAVVGIDEKNDWIYFTAQERSSIERQLYRVKSDGSGMTQVSRESGTHGVSMSPDTRFYFDTFSDIRTLPALSLHSADGVRRQTIATGRSEILTRLDVQYPQLLTIPASDGFAMPAQVLQPKGFRPDKKHPVILYVYGGPSAPTVANSWQRKTLEDQLLLSEGYVLIQVDNRSATGASKQLENTILKVSGEPETADLLAAIKWVKAQPWADPDRVGVWGWSGGGTMTLNLMTRSKEFKAGISVAPVTDWRFYDTKWAECFMKRPEDNPEGYERTSLVKRAKDLEGRLMIVWGTYDDNVHPQNEEAFVDALVAAGKKVDVMVYPMRQHGIADTPATVHLRKKMIEFWKREL
jgi:dipeptidyl-peptidase-4